MQLGKARPTTVAALIMASALIALIALLVLAPAVRSAADTFLLAFRVQQKSTPVQIIVAPLPQLPASTLGQDEAASRTLANLLRLQLSGGESVAGAEDAQALVGFTMERLVRFPLPSSITVYIHGVAQVSLDATTAAQMLRDAGVRGAVVPASITNTVIDGVLEGAVRERWDTLGLSLTYWQLRPPHLQTSSGPNIEALRPQLVQAYLALDPQVGQQLMSVQDWDQTVVVPVPPGARRRSVRVNRQPATLIESTGSSVPDSYVVWQNRGVFNYLHAPVTGDQILRYAQSVSGGG